MMFIFLKKKDFQSRENIGDDLVPNSHLSHKGTRSRERPWFPFSTTHLLVEELGLKLTDLESEKKMLISVFFSQDGVQL